MVRPIIGERRSTVEILCEMLSTCKEGGVNKTSIMYRCNLSYTQLSQYLEFLTDQMLMERNVDGQYELTPRGEATLDQVSEVIDLLRQMG